MKDNPFISVVTPVYRCEECLITLYERIKQTLETITSDYEIIMVNDASPDNSWKLIKTIAVNDSKVVGINLTKNFGQHYAITAGLDNAMGDWIVVMDCDLQDQPEEIIKLYNKALEGFDVVFGKRIKRNDSYIKKLSSKIFFSLYNYFTEANFDSSIANFCICKKEVIQNMLQLREQARSFYLFIFWTGCNIGFIDVVHARRTFGKTSYSFNKLVRFAADSLISQTNKPLRISIKFGILMAFLSILFVIYLFLKKILWGVPIMGWTSIMISIFFTGGLILANIGIVGLYIGKIFNEVKNRPLYIIKEKIN